MPTKTERIEQKKRRKKIKQILEDIFIDPHSNEYTKASYSKAFIEARIHKEFPSALWHKDIYPIFLKGRGELYKSYNGHDCYAKFINIDILDEREECEWCENIPSLEKIDKTYFFREYCWVVINSGMKNKIAEKIFKTFWNEGKFNFEAIKHPQKNKAIKKVYDRLDFNFEHLKQSNNKLKFLRSLPFIGDITQYHLARNLGLDYAKPDRHLVRIASLFGFNNVQIFCNDIAGLTGDKIGVVDLVLWRFATLFDNYREMIKNFEEV